MENQNNSNKVFISFIIFCALMSAFVIYFLVTRPAKILLEANNTDSETIEFYYKKDSDIPMDNPSMDEITSRREDGRHVVLILLTDKKRLTKNTNYQQLLDAYKTCDFKLPCKMYEIDKKKYLQLAKKRKY